MLKWFTKKGALKESMRMIREGKVMGILTQSQADIMQQVIEKNPKQWFWMHKRWK